MHLGIPQSFSSFLRSSLSNSAVLLALAVCTILSSQAISQVSPGAIEPIVTEQAPLQNPDSVIEDNSPEKVSPEGREQAVDLEVQIPVDVIGLNYLPDEHGLSSKAIVSIQNEVRDFGLIGNGAYTLSQLNGLADRLTQILRQQGYSLARVYLPAQKIENKSVILQVVSAVLANVDAIDGRLYSSAQLERVFADEINSAVRSSALESKLLLLNDLPGIDVRGVFSPAERAGFTQMRLNLSEQDKLAFRLRLDNYNTESTGDLRFLAGTSVRNLTGHRDSLDVDFVQTFDAGDLTNVSIHYQVFSPQLRHRYGLRFSGSDYATDSAADDAEGENSLGELYWRSAWIRSSAVNVSSKASLAIKQAEQNIVGAEKSDELTVIGLGLYADNVDRLFNGLNGLTVDYSRGLNSTFGSLDSIGTTESIRPNISGEFSKWLVTLQRVQAIGNSNRLNIKLAGQFTNDRLSSLEQVNLGGPYSVRAYALGVASGDRSKFASLEWSSDWFPFANSQAYNEYLWRELLDVSLFVDYGKVANVVDGGEEEGAGAGLALVAADPAGQWRATLSAAVPFQDQDQFGNKLDDQQIWFGLSAFF